MKIKKKFFFPKKKFFKKFFWPFFSNQILIFRICLNASKNRSRCPKRLLESSGESWGLIFENFQKIFLLCLFPTEFVCFKFWKILKIFICGWNLQSGSDSRLKHLFVTLYHLIFKVQYLSFLTHVLKSKNMKKWWF